MPAQSTISTLKGRSEFEKASSWRICAPFKHPLQLYAECIQLYATSMNPFLTKNQAALLRLLYTNPEKSFYMQEIGKILGKKPGIFQRTLNGLVEKGLLKSEYRANARFFQANTGHRLYAEIKEIIAKSFGVDTVLKKFVKPLRGVKIALLYGSFAKGKERYDSDIDLLIVGRPQVEDRLVNEIPKLERQLQREINYKLYSEAEYRRRRAAHDPFLEEILSDKKIVLKGNPDVV